MISSILLHLDVISPLVCFFVVMAILAVRKYKPKGIDIIVLSFLETQAILNILATYLEWTNVNNQTVYIINCVVSFFKIALFQYNVFSCVGWFRKFIVISSILFVILCSFNLIWLRNEKEFDSNDFAIASFFIVLMCVCFLRICLNDYYEHNIFRFREIWFVSGWLFYYSVSFFVFISYNYLSFLNSDSIGLLWRMHNLFLLLMCAFITKGFLCKHTIKEFS